MLNKGVAEGEVGEEENGCSSEGAGAPRESAPASQWLKGENDVNSSTHLSETVSLESWTLQLFDSSQLSEHPSQGLPGLWHNIRLVTSYILIIYSNS